jgi:hypothetical protein
VQLAVRLATQEQLTNAVVSLLLNGEGGLLSCRTLHAALYEHWQAQLPDHEAVNRVAYSFVASLQQHAQRSALLKLTSRALQGDAPAQALWRLAEVQAAVRRVLDTARALPRYAVQSPGVLHQDDARQLLRRLLPNRTVEQLAALCESCIVAPQCADGCGGFSCVAALSIPEDELLAAVRADFSSGDLKAASGPVPSGEAALVSTAAGQGRVEDSGQPLSKVGEAPEKDTSQACAVTQGGVPPRRVVQASDARTREPSFLVLIAEQHAQQLLALDAAVCDALADLQQGEAGISELAVMQRLRQIESLCKDVCAADLPLHPCSGIVAMNGAEGREQSVGLPPGRVLRVGLKEGALLRSTGDCDEGAAWEWLRGLQGRAQGHESSAGLPEVV